MKIGDKKLYRARDDRRIAGVCGGLSKHFNIEARLLRWIFILTAEVTAPIYLLLWIYLEEEPLEQPEDRPLSTSSSTPIV